MVSYRGTIREKMTLVAGGTLQDVIWTGNGFIEQLVIEVCPDMQPALMQPQSHGGCWEPC